MDVTIRQIKKADLSNGFLESLDSLRKASDIDKEKANAIFDSIQSNPMHVIYVAVIDSSVIGSASILIEQKFIHGGGKVGHIEDVVVKKEYQGKGIGQKLVTVLLDHAKKEGCYKTILDSDDAVVPFYEKLGFRRHSSEMRYDY